MTPPVVFAPPFDKRSAIERNDPALAAYVGAGDEAARQRELELILLRVRPVITAVLNRFERREFRPQAEDRDDVTSVVTLRFIDKLRGLASGDTAPIENLDSYVAVLAQNAATDVLRERYPEMRRLRRRVRRLIVSDARLAIWNSGNATVCGKSEWQGRDAGPLAIESASVAMSNRRNAADSLLAILARAGQPVLFDELISLVATLWDIADGIAIDVAETDVADAHASPEAGYESRRFLEAMWEEVKALRAAQRAALLLNLRDLDGSNALALLVILEIASFDDIAAALEITPQRLGDLWKGLPLEDQAIASMYGISRQRVINLRRAARERLIRRLR